MSILNDKLKLLEAKHGRKSSNHKRFKVYYGWRKLSKSIKRESLAVIFINETTGPRLNKDNNDGVTRYINIAYSRYQTDEEMKDAKGATRIYTIYEIFMDDRKIQNSLELALDANFDADKNNVSIEERQTIKKKLREVYLANHPNYRPHAVQLSINIK